MYKDLELRFNKYNFIAI